MTTSTRGGRLAANFRWMIAAQLASKLVAVVIIFLLARYFGDVTFGRYAIALAIPMALEALGDLGISQAMVRAGAGRPSVVRSDVLAALPAKVTLAVFVVVASAATASLLGLSEEIVEVTIYLAIAKALESMTFLARSVFQAFERMEFEALSIVLESATRVTFIAYALLSGFGLVGIAKATVVSAALVFAVTAYEASWRFVRSWSWHIDLARSASLLAAGLPLGVVWLLNVIPMRLDVVIVGQLAGDRAAGLFAASVRLIEPLTVLPYTIAVVLLPLAARHIFEEIPTLPALFRATLKVTLVVALGGAITIVGGAPMIIGALFGDSFSAAIPSTAVLALTLPALFVDSVLVSFLLALYEHRRLILCQTIGLAANLFVMLLTVPDSGPMGAAIAVWVGELTTVVCCFSLVPRLRTLASPRILGVFVVALPSALMLAAGVVVGPLLATSLALVLFALGLRAVGAFDLAEVAYLHSAPEPFGRLSRLLLVGPRGV